MHKAPFFSKDSTILTKTLYMWGEAALSRLALVAVIQLLFFASNSNAYDGKNFRISAVAGAPYMAGVQLAYLGQKRVRFGLSFGSFPVEAVLESRISYNPIAMDFTNDDGDNFTIVPSANYSFIASSAFVQFDLTPEPGGFFSEISYSYWNFGTTFSGTLRNEVTNTSAPGAISGSGNLEQHMVSLAFGYDIRFSEKFNLDIVLGGSWVARVSHNVSVGGNAASLGSAVDSTIEQDFDDAATDVENQANEAVDQYRESVVALPVFYIAFGFAF